MKSYLILQHLVEASTMVAAATNPGQPEALATDGS